MLSISAIVPACNRPDELRYTLKRISECEPPPSEILVHVDAGNPAILTLLDVEFPHVRVLTSRKLLGPGGSRHRLLSEARHPWVANFDDDSFPLDRDYFSRVNEAVTLSPEAAILSAVTIHEASDFSSTPAVGYPRLASVFSGCGCVYNRHWYFRTSGYVPLPVAYGMEEVDLSLQLHALGGCILELPQLRVFHHDPSAVRPSSKVLAYSLANIALFGYLRFTFILWPIVAIQLISRVLWTARRGWSEGTLSGIAMIARHLAEYQKYRHPVPARKVLSWLRLRHAREQAQIH